MTLSAASDDHGDDDLTGPVTESGVDNAELGLLVASAEPAVVFSSLARLCVPTFSDSCTVDIVEHERAAYRISYPLGNGGSARAARLGCLAEHRPVALRRLSIRFQSDTADDAAAYFGVVTHTWVRHSATATDAARAQSLTDRAVAAVTDARRADGQSSEPDVRLGPCRSNALRR